MSDVQLTSDAASASAVSLVTRYETLQRFRKNRLGMVAASVVLVTLVVAAFGNVIAPYPYAQQDTAAVVKYLGPAPPLSPGHLLGTDELGRDTLSRVIDGAQVSITVALIVQGVMLLIGVPIGLLAGWYGGRLDNLLMRFTDLFYAFPDLLLVIVLAAAFHGTAFGDALSGLLLVFIAIGATSWMTMARLMRGQVLALKESEFVEAAQALGFSRTRILFRHVLPNTVGVMVAAVTLGIPRAILAEATLAYLGIGVQPPRASWGSMIADGEQYISTDPYVILFPAVALIIALAGFTFFGDALRDTLDPRSQTRR